MKDLNSPFKSEHQLNPLWVSPGGPFPPPPFGEPASAPTPSSLSLSCALFITVPITNSHALESAQAMSTALLVRMVVACVEKTASLAPGGGLLFWHRGTTKSYALPLQPHNYKFYRQTSL